MSLLKIAWRSVQHRSLSSILTGVSMALGVALVVTVLVILNTVDDTFRRNAEGFHLIVGAKGGGMELVLNSVFHLGKPPATVPYDLYLEFAPKAEGGDAKAFFARLDTNGDGVVAATEITPLIRLLCERADRSPTGWINQQELAAAASRPPFAAAKLDVPALFEKLQKNAAGLAAVASPMPAEVRKQFGGLGDPITLLDDMLEDADQDKGDYGVITKDEIRRVLQRQDKPYGFARVRTDDVLKAFGAVEAGKFSRPEQEDLPRELGEKLVTGLFAYLLSLADREPDGQITADELEYAVNHPGLYGDRIEHAIPICLGDSYEAGGRRFRVVATTPQMFEIEYAEGRKYRFADGRNIHEDYQNTDHFLEAVIGSVVARQTGLKVGDTFRPEHGVSAGGVKHDAFTIVGVLEPTGTPNDRALFVNIEGFWVLEGHSKDNRKRIHADGPDGEVRLEPLPLELREITAILIRTKDAEGYQADLSAQKIYGDLLGQTEGRIQGNVRDLSTVAQAVYPTREVAVLFGGLVGHVRLILLILAWLMVVVAAVAITVGIYNSMNDRIRDIAVMRALGASRTVVMFVVLLESTLLALLGGMAGFAAAHFLIGGVMSPLWIEPQTGVSIRFWQFVPYEALLVPGLVLLSALAGFLPALAAYRADVGKVLSAAP